MNQHQLLAHYARRVDLVLRRHRIGTRVTGGTVLLDRVNFRAPMVGFTDLERDLAQALHVDRCRLSIEVEVRREDQR